MRAGILRILPISRAGGTPLPMAGRLTQLAKIIFRDLYNRSSAVDANGLVSRGRRANPVLAYETALRRFWAMHRTLAHVNGEWFF